MVCAQRYARRYQVGDAVLVSLGLGVAPCVGTILRVWREAGAAAPVFVQFRVWAFERAAGTPAAAGVCACSHTLRQPGAGAELQICEGADRVVGHVTVVAAGSRDIRCTRDVWYTNG